MSASSLQLDLDTGTVWGTNHELVQSIFGWLSAYATVHCILSIWIYVAMLSQLSQIPKAQTKLYCRITGYFWLLVLPELLNHLFSLLIFGADYDTNVGRANGRYDGKASPL